MGGVYGVLPLVADLHGPQRRVSLTRLTFRASLGADLLRRGNGDIHPLLRGGAVMYRVLRDTHLLVGLGLFAFVLMFGVSSVKFAHRDWFSNDPVETHLTVQIDPSVAETSKISASWAAVSFRRERSSRMMASRRSVRFVM